jgi:hypothetical protein
LPKMIGRSLHGNCQCGSALRPQRFIGRVPQKLKPPNVSNELAW